jgi:uncharacterized protein (TIGR02466 family)
MYTALGHVHHAVRALLEQADLRRADPAANRQARARTEGRDGATHERYLHQAMRSRQLCERRCRCGCDTRFAVAGAGSTRRAMRTRRQCRPSPQVFAQPSHVFAHRRHNSHMSIRSLFATQVYCSALRARGVQALNAQLAREIQQLRRDDAAGRRWSVRNYPGGFTSYGSVSRLHRLSPTFATLERRLAPHLRAFCRALEFDLEGRQLAMTDCWANIMPRGVVHGLHLHPLSSISGTYYVRAPKGAAGLKFEDPRLAFLMAAPPQRAGCREANRRWVVFEARAGQVVLFESWLRHEVPANAAPGERVSVSFNYSWF